MYYDFNKKDEKIYYFYLIEYGEGMNVFSDIEDCVDDFILFLMGLELLFKMKEVFGEF